MSTQEQPDVYADIMGQSDVLLHQSPSGELVMHMAQNLPARFTSKYTTNAQHYGHC